MFAISPKPTVSAPHMYVDMWQEREAALDAVMERTRQEATEAGLKDGLKKALQLLDAIRARYMYVHILIKCEI